MTSKLKILNFFIEYEKLNFFFYLFSTSVEYLYAHFQRQLKVDVIFGWKILLIIFR